MRSRIMPGVLVMLLGWILAPGLAHAVALGKIDVTSHLGEPFYAEVPLQLEKGEKLSGVTVEIAQPGDYRILEVYRDSVLSTIRTSVEDDSRGPRIKLVSDGAIESPFFNLVLKVHYGNATSFKKYPVFLDLPSAAVSTAKPKPKVQAPKPEVKQAVTAAPQPAAEEKKQAPAAQSSTKKEAAPFKPFSGWARINRYGPMVYGDTLMTVARRLRVDDRYTIKQVMVALFDKNKDKFDKQNMNLIKAGAYLKVPTAKEVEAITPRQAIKMVAEQDRQWQALKKQPHYAAVAKAQKTRYSGRVKVGESADGVPATAEPDKEMKGERGVQLPSKAKPAPSAAATAAAPAKAPAPADEAASQTSSEMQALQQQNAELQKKLQQADENIAALNAKLSSPDLVASNARIKKLELKLARMQTDLDAARQQAAIAAKNSINTWLVYGLGGLAVLLLAAIGYLLRRERPHPAEQLPPEEASFEDEFAEPSAGMFEPEPIAPQIDESVAEEFAQEEQIAEETSFGEEPEAVEEESSQGVADQEGVLEEADPNVDYVAEADVYLRYGMEEEALRQLKMAILQRPDNVDAYCKLIKLLHGRGETGELDTLIEDGRSALSGDALVRFESEITLLGSAETGEAEVEDSGLTDMDAPVGGEADIASEAGLSGNDEAGLDIGELEWSFGDEESQQEELPSAEASPEGGEEVVESSAADDEADASITFDLSEMEGETEEAGDETVHAPQDSGESESVDEIDLDLSGLVTDEEAAEAEAPDHAPSPEAGEAPQYDHDVSHELDELLGELNVDAEIDAQHGGAVTAGSLAIDMARSLVAQGQLDDAEMTFQSSLEGDFRCQSLLGLAEIAQQRGDAQKAAQMLAEAEPLLDDNSREWFERLKEKQGE